MNVPDGILRCPACKQGLLAEGVACRACARVYPRHDGFVDLLPPREDAPSFAQAAMESRAIVSIYESRFWRRSPSMHLVLGLPFEREAAIVRESLALRTSDTVLDLACGPGIYTRSIARAVPDGSVVGLDMSPAMLARAAERAAERGIDNVLWVRGDAMELPMADGTLNAVSCCGALHLFPDMHQVLAEIRRVLEPSGRFVVAMVRHPQGAIGGAAMRALRALGVASFGEEELERALGAAGFAEPERHYGRRLWMIWSATKPVA